MNDEPDIHGPDREPRVPYRPGAQRPARFLTRAEVNARGKMNWMIALALFAFSALILFVTLARLTLNVRGGDLS